MILRRITKHLTEQNWLAVTLDFLIVVFGVFIGLQASNWNTERQDRIEEAAFLEQLHNDLVISSKQSARTEEHRLRQAKFFDSAVELIFGETSARELYEQECSAMAYSHTTYVGRATLPSLIQLQSAGRASIISDSELAQQLAGLTQRLEALDTVIREVRGVEIVSKYPKVFQLQSIMIPSSGGNGSLERDAKVKCQLNNILNNHALSNDIVYNADAYDAFMRDGLLPWIEQMSRVHQRVDSLLGIVHQEVKQ